MSTAATTLQRLRPEAWQAIEFAVGQANDACPDGLLALCRARIRMLLGSPATATDPKSLAVADYARSDLFDDLDRLAVEFTEQYFMDVASMPDGLVEALRSKLGTEGLYALAMGLYAVDQIERLEISAAVRGEDQA